MVRFLAHPIFFQWSVQRSAFRDVFTLHAWGVYHVLLAQKATRCSPTAERLVAGCISFGQSGIL